MAGGPAEVVRPKPPSPTAKAPPTPLPVIAKKPEVALAAAAAPLVVVTPVLKPTPLIADEVQPEIIPGLTPPIGFETEVQAKKGVSAAVFQPA